MKKLAEIYEGWRNNILPPEKLKEQIQMVSAQRMEICEQCEHHSKHHNTPARPDAHCVNCGCTLAAKTKCLSCSCPLEKWTGVLSSEKEREYIDHVKNSEVK